MVHPTRDGDFELVTLRGGDRAVRDVRSGEVMHPSVGPWGEANALYVEQSRLADRLQQPGPPLCLFDVGLGAATNLAAALTCARDLGDRRRRELHVVSFERDLAPLRRRLGQRRIAAVGAADPAGDGQAQPSAARFAHGS